MKPVSTGGTDVGSTHIKHILSKYLGCHKWMPKEQNKVEYK